MPKKNDILVRNIFAGKDKQAIKQVFVRKMAGLINKLENAKIVQ